MRRDATPLGLLGRVGSPTQGSRYATAVATRQPWAEDRSPVGAEDLPEGHDGLLLPLVLLECQKEVGNRQLAKGDKGTASSLQMYKPQTTG